MRRGAGVQRASSGSSCAATAISTTGLTQLIEGNWARSERLLTQGLEARGCAARELPARRPRGAAARRGRSARPVARARARDFRRRRDERAADARGAAARRRRAGRGRRDARHSRAAEGRPTGRHRVARPRLSRARRSCALLALLPRLARASLPPAERDALAKLAVQGELARAELTGERLAEVWGSLPSELRAVPALVAERARALAVSGAATRRSASSRPR